MTGKIRYWNLEKAYGFIQPDGEKDEVQYFFHVNDCAVEHKKDVVMGSLVSFELIDDKRGTRACDIKILMS